jgi:hypothetical protein
MLTWQYMLMRHPELLLEMPVFAAAMWSPPCVGITIAKELAHARHAPYDRTPEQYGHTREKIDGYWGGASDQSIGAKESHPHSMGASHSELRRGKPWHE